MSSYHAERLFRTLDSLSEQRATWEASAYKTSNRKLPRQVDNPEVETSALNTRGLNWTGGTSPRDSCGRYSL